MNCVVVKVCELCGRLVASIVWTFMCELLRNLGV